MQENILRCDLSVISQSLIDNLDDTSHEPSIAVLPFTDLDEESRQNYHGQWLAADVTHHLSRFRHLSVMGRSSGHVASDRHESLQAIGRQLGTRYLATGTVQSKAGRLMTVVELIESTSGKQLWHSFYHGDGEGLTDLGDDLAKEIATGLAVSIDAMERARLESREDLDDAAKSAAPLILMADHLTKQFQHLVNERARQLVDKALSIDPRSARAYAVLSRTHHLDGRYGWTPDPEGSMERAIELAETAICLDPMEASGHAELGMNRHFQRDYDPALAAYRRALDINPNDPDILADFGHFLISDGVPEQAVELLGMALHLRPDRAEMYRYYLACAFYILGDDETVLSLLSQVSDNKEGHRILAMSYARLGMSEHSAHHADLAMKAHPNFSLAHWQTILPHRDPDLRERIIEGMARGGFH